MEIRSTSIGSSASVQALQTAFMANDAKAKRLANAESDPLLEKDLAELPSDADNVGAQTKVIKTKDQMVGTLLDMFA